MKEMNNTENFTDKEWEEIASLLSEENGGNKDLLNRFLAEDIHSTGKDWKELKDMNKVKEINTDKAWDKLYSRLSKDELIADKAPARIRIMRSAFMKVAAAAVIILGIGSAVLYMNNTGLISRRIVVTTNSDQKNLLVSLPDGSKIYLNRNTELSYRSNFGKHNRNVKLTGEAFFEIAPDKSMPFIIDAGQADVKVVGTSFNVITKNVESDVEVFVKTGKVLLSSNTGTKSIALDPGYIGTIDSSGATKKLNDDKNYLSWNTGLLAYSGQKLEIVFRDLKRVYNMDIVADDPGILDYPWTSPINNSSKDKIIRLICASFNLSYTMDGNVYHLTKK